MKLNREDIFIFIKQNLKVIFFSILTSIFIVVAVYYLFINNSNSIDKNDYNRVSNIEQVDVVKESTEDIEETIYIDIKGAVIKPGVYEFTKKDRVKDAIDRAGGLDTKAETKNINLSQKLRDQMLIYIPSEGEKIIVSSDTDSNKKVININTASKEELMKITGVGETKAKAIIEYRENKGEFKKKEDIVKVRGIGKNTFEKIKEEIEV